MDATVKRYSVSMVTQGDHKFYTLSVPSEVLAKCCFATTREEDPLQGFQRVLDTKRAEEIAKYIDSGLGTIPTSIILSAQPEAELEIVGKGKTLQFKMHPKAFLILDGQHRVYGFALAKTNLRVPVVVYNSLSRRDESRLFIDINSKQKGVPNELLLDIKKLAEYESTVEQQLRKVFDNLKSNQSSAMLGLLSPSSKSNGKISRVTFNSAVKPLIILFRGKNDDEIYEIINSYLSTFRQALHDINASESITNSTVFKAIVGFFPLAASKVKDRFGTDYSEDNFYEVLQPMFSRLKAAKFIRPGSSYKALQKHMEDCLKVEFIL